MDDHSPIPVALAATIQTTADGDPPTGATLGGPQQVLSNGIRHLQDRVAPLAGSTADIQRVVGAKFVFGTNTTDVADFDTGNWIRKLKTSAPAATAMIDLDLPHGHRLRSLILRARTGGNVEVTIYQDSITSVFDFGGDIDEQPVVIEIGNFTNTAGSASIRDVTVTLAGDGHLIDRQTCRYYAYVEFANAGAEAYGFIGKTRIPAGNSIDVGAA